MAGAQRRPLPHSFDIWKASEAQGAPNVFYAVRHHNALQIAVAEPMPNARATTTNAATPLALFQDRRAWEISGNVETILSENRLTGASFAARLRDGAGIP
jgi:hypothetical protein